jgi:adenosine deaminase
LIDGLTGGHASSRAEFAFSSAGEGGEPAAPQHAPNPHFSDAFLQAIPKADLHVHLDGSVRPATLLALAAEHGVALPADSVAGLRATVFKERYADLPEYLHGFVYCCAVMQGAPSLERIAYEFAQDNYREGVRYFEVRFAPQLHADDELDLLGVLGAVDKGLRRAREEADAARGAGAPRHGYAIIVSALRMFAPSFSSYYKRFCALHPQTPRGELFGLASERLAEAAVAARDDLGLPVVALDIAGAEAGNPAKDHAAAFRKSAKAFLSQTVHAGEAWGPDSIEQALTDLGADRVGHGYHLFSVERLAMPAEEARAYVARLIDHVASKRITLEVCPTSNLQTMPELGMDLRRHALRQMLDHDLSVTVATDNRTVSNTTVARELRRVVDAFELSPAQLRSIVAAGFDRSFFPDGHVAKQAFVAEQMAYYDSIAALEHVAHQGRA